MDSSDAIQFLVLIVLICLSAFFSSAETSMTTANKIRIQTLAEQGNKKAKTLLKVTGNSGKMLSTILIGNNLVNIGASSLATSMAIRMFGNAAVGICTGVLTLLILIFGEITPKTMATLNEERQMIYNVFDFGDSQAKDVMVPRIDVAFADIGSSYDDLISMFREEKHTRFPVYEDTTDNVVGIVNVKDLLLMGSRDNFSLKEIMREPYFTFEYKKTSELLVEMKEESVSFAVVLDEYGATAGIITLEDLLEEIVGDIHDEYDDTEEDDLTEIIPGREFVALGAARLDDLNEVLPVQIESEDYDSIGGYIIEQLDRFPEPGESITTPDHVRLVVDKVEKNRIEAVHIFLPEIQEQPEEE